MSGVDIVISFDTTGSMRPASATVKQRLSELLGQLFTSIPGLRLSFVAHGDYYDKANYIVQDSGFVSSEQDMFKWLESLTYTVGGDWRECYGYVLQHISLLDWRQDSQKAVVMIGDAEPHHPGKFNHGFTTTDWRTELQKVTGLGAEVHAIQCLGDENDFWRALAKRGGGKWLPLAQFRDIVQVLIGLGLSAGNTEALTAYVDENAAAFNLGLRQVFDRIMSESDLGDDLLKYEFGGALYTPTRASSRSSSFSPSRRTVRSTWKGRPEDLTAVPEWRFQMLDVPASMPIKDFVDRFIGVPFARGKGFYQLQGKSYTIQEGKEVVLRDKDTGTLLTGKEARNAIGVPYGERAQISISRIPFDVRKKYDVFVQSTSYNRKLIGGSAFLYEVPPPTGVRD